MNDDTIIRWLARLSLVASVLIFFGSVIASLGAVVGFWPHPDLSIGQGLPNLPTFAMILFLMGLFGVFFINRDA